MAYLERAEQLRRGIHTYFAEFGPDIAEEIYAQLLRPGGMKRLLRKLGLPDPQESAAQYEAILRHLRREGTDGLFHHTTSEVAPEDRPPPRSGPRTTPASGSMDRVLSEQAKKTYLKKVKAQSSGSSSLAHSLTRTPPATPAEDIDAPTTPTVGFRKSPAALSPGAKPANSRPVVQEPPTPPFSKKPKAEAAPSTPAPEPAPSPTAETSPAAPDAEPTRPKGTLPDGSWDGVTERRSGEERRKGADRRASVELIYSNRRYGGDRRAKKERRRNWPPKDKNPGSKA